MARAGTWATGDAPMAEYHGDLMYRTGNVYKGVDDTNYIVAIVIAAFLGATGAHRFYMNDHKIAYLYFIPFACAGFASMMKLDLTIIFWEVVIASVFVLFEIVFFVWKWLHT